MQHTRRHRTQSTSAVLRHPVATVTKIVTVARATSAVAMVIRVSCTALRNGDLERDLQQRRITTRV